MRGMVGIIISEIIIVYRGILLLLLTYFIVLIAFSCFGVATAHMPTTDCEIIYTLIESLAYFCDLFFAFFCQWLSV